MSSARTDRETGARTPSGAGAETATWALVPVKGFARGKSRLAPALSDGARAAFARRLFEHVVTVLAASPSLAGVLIATDDEAVAAAARAHGAEARLDAPAAAPLRLSEVIDAGLADLSARGAGAALVLMADLPRLTVADVDSLVATLATYEVVAVRADDGCHTNALGLRPPSALPTAFGRPDSFDTHVITAAAAGLRVAVIDNARIAFDVDAPADHARLLLRP